MSNSNIWFMRKVSSSYQSFSNCCQARQLENASSVRERARKRARESHKKAWRARERASLALSGSHFGWRDGTTSSCLIVAKLKKLTKSKVYMRLHCRMIRGQSSQLVATLISCLWPTIFTFYTFFFEKKSYNNKNFFKIHFWNICLWNMQI